ncbi:MAG: GumC family protein [Gammaproteobacteria bacterium]
MNTYVEAQPYEAPAKSLAEYVDAVRRRWRMLAMTSGGILLVALLLAVGLPSVYRARATILIEQQEIPAELVRSTVTSYADQRIQMISQLVMTSANLGGLIEKYNLYESERKRLPAEVILGNMRDDIKLEMVSADVVDPRSGQARKATIAFTLTYDNESPALSQKVTNELVSLFLNENLKNRAESASEASSFFADEAKRLKVQVAELEAKLADFKSKNVGALPEQFALNMQMMDRTAAEKSEVERQISALQERRIFLEAQLAQTGPLTPLSSETGQRILGPADRLRVLESDYVTLTARYGPDHPDVVKTRREMEVLRAQVGGAGANAEMRKQLDAARLDLTTAKEQYGPEHPDVKKLERTVAALEAGVAAAARMPAQANTPVPDNPAYIQTQANLKALTNDLALANAKRAELQQALEEYSRKLAAAPEAEKVYRGLLRDYETASAKYQEITAKQMEAQVSQTLETERKGERFTLIEPPLLPEKAAKPNRVAIILLGFVLAVAGGIGAVAALESMDQAVRGRRMVADLVGVAPLAVVPYIVTPSEVQVQKRPVKLAIVGVVIAAVVVLVAFHYFVKPLDVTWFILMRRLGLSE